MAAKRISMSYSSDLQSKEPLLTHQRSRFKWIVNLKITNQKRKNVKPFSREPNEVSVYSPGYTRSLYERRSIFEQVAVYII
jgi:hypothetical protein